MDRSEVIKLISTTKEQDAYGVWRETESETEVFCQVDSVTRSEFFEGGRSGLNPEYRFTLFAGDYNDERTLEFREKRDGVYRVFHGRNDIVELYAERKGGVNAAPAAPNEGPGEESGVSK